MFAIPNAQGWRKVNELTTSFDILQKKLCNLTSALPSL